MLDEFDAASNQVHIYECGEKAVATGTCRIIKDSGGRTLHGISENAHPEAWRNRVPTLDDFKAIIRSAYWTPLQCDKLPSPLNLALLDFAYNSGNKRAVKSLQMALNELGAGLDVDGRMGEATLAAIASAKAPETGKPPGQGEAVAAPRMLARMLCAWRRDYLMLLVEKDSAKYGPYQNGWLKRIDRLEQRIG